MNYFVSLALRFCCFWIPYGYEKKRTASHANGLKLELRGGQGDWYTFFANLVRQDYLKHARNLGREKCVVDIGAFAVVAAQAVGPTGRVYCFEPDPCTYRRLCENIQLNGLGENIQPQNLAVAGISGFSNFM